MALLHVHFTSEVLEGQAQMDVILPEKPCPWPDGRWPALYLLHGLHGDQSVWQRRTSVERYAEPRNLAVIMPSVHNGFYTDMRHGPRYWTFISEELPAVCERMFPLRADRAGRFAAGLSMGGYGALKLGLRLPERYAAVASLSGAVDMAGIAAGDHSEAEERFFTDIFGDVESFLGSDDDLMAVAGRLGQSGTVVPSIYVACGTEDFLYDGNRRFYAAYGEALSITYEEGPGEHTWDFWDAYVQRVLAWLPVGG